MLFADYPTVRLTPETRLALAPGLTPEEALARALRIAAMTGGAPRKDLLPGEATLAAMLGRLAEGPATAALLVAELPAPRAWRAQRALAWLVKLDLLRPATG
jgi:hypothetical protein